MPRFVYRPDHPSANSNGMVDVFIAGSKFDRDAAPSVISDIMEPLRHMANGHIYDSKAKFREVTKAYGCVEVGTETATMLKPRKPIKLDRRERVESIKKAIYELKNQKNR